MSLPKSFVSDEAYFKASVNFLHSHAWVFREANTSCIKALDCMPTDFKDYFLGLSNERLNAFPFVHEPMEACPEQLHCFRQQIASLTPPHSASTSQNGAAQASMKCSKQNRKINMKKLHEIEQLAQRIHQDCSEMHIRLIIDLGSGLGYLSAALFQLQDNYLILGLEADQKRVETARERCKSFLPQTTLSSVNYQKEFIQADDKCSARIAHHAAELAQGHGLATDSSTALIGLHACADLSISAMRLFLKMPQVRSLHIMPCCYHKLSLSQDANGSDTSHFVNFPLSKELKKAMSDPSVAEIDCFNRPFMRLACQQTNSRWSCTGLEHGQHGRQMYTRALANALCEADELVKIRGKSAVAAATDSDTFEDLQQCYLLFDRQTGSPLRWRTVHERRYNQITERYGDGRGWCLAEALCCLQTSMQKLCENLLLYDRLCYLREAAAEQQVQLEVRYEKLFDEHVSPRCHVLIAKKL